MTHHNWLEGVKKYDPERYNSLVNVEDEIRKNIAALYALNLEVANIAWNSSDKNIAMIKLKWWEDCIETIDNPDRYKAHPFLKILSLMIDQRIIEKKKLQTLVKSRYFDVFNEPFLSLNDQTDYIEQTSVNLMQLSLDCLLGKNKTYEKDKLAKCFGVPFGLARLMLAMRSLALKKRYSLYFEKKTDYDDYFSLKANKNVTERVLMEAKKALSSLSLGIELSNSFREKSIFSIFQPAVSYGPLLRKIRKNPSIVFQEKINIGFLDKLKEKMVYLRGSS